MPYPAMVVGILERLENGMFILAVPLNQTPAMVREVWRAVAVAALPVIPIPHVHEAQTPVEVA
jgi:hypothetical protein